MIAFERGEQEPMNVEVARRARAGCCQSDEFIENRPQPFDLSLSETEHLHRIGVELGSEFSRRIAVGNQVEVLPEQVLDEVVGVNAQDDHCGLALGLVGELRTGCDQQRLTDSYRYCRAFKGHDH